MSMVNKSVHLQKTYQRLQLLKLQDLTFAKWQIDKVISPLSKRLLSLNLVGCWLHEGCSGCKHLHHHCLIVLLLDSVFGRTYKSFLRMFYIYIPRTRVASPGKNPLHLLKSICLTKVSLILNFMCKTWHTMCLKENKNSRNKWS